MLLKEPPLSLYIHIPWCVQKCPYCDFNSHALKHDIPEDEYVQALLDDLVQDIDQFEIQRPIHSIFFGGGTPSLFSAKAIEKIINGVNAKLAFESDIEVTLEANPGTVEANKFAEFSTAGINRLSIGVQSFANNQLIQLGRIHDSGQAEKAAELARNSGVKSFNLDLMHGLPKQNVEQALFDLEKAIALSPDHISWYQLTIEPNTSFYSKPPKLPEDDLLWQIQEEGVALLAKSGYGQYEISAYAKPGYQSRHNKNYWRFGDYLGIGCGAHGKITNAQTNSIKRTVKVKHPKGYMEQERTFMDDVKDVGAEDLPFEFMMNRLRLTEQFNLDDFAARTGLETPTVIDNLDMAKSKGLLAENAGQWRVTDLGHRYLNTLLELFL